MTKQTADQADYGLAVSAIRAAVTGENRSRLEPSTQDFGEAEVDRRVLNQIKHGRRQAQEA